MAAKNILKLGPKKWATYFVYIVRSDVLTVLTDPPVLDELVGFDVFVQRHSVFIKINFYMVLI